MKKKYIVKKTLEFNEIIQKEASFKNKYFVVYFRKNEYQYDRFGISVGKKIGKAVIRNKYKRRIRNILIDYQKEYNDQNDYIIIIRIKALALTYEEMKKELIELLCNKGAKK